LNECDKEILYLATMIRRMVRGDASPKHLDRDIQRMNELLDLRIEGQQHALDDLVELDQEYEARLKGILYGDKAGG
jgi:hypothetical protein